MACLFNTLAMLTTCLMFVTAILLPVSSYVGRYHLMLVVILLAAVLGVSVLVSGVLALAGQDQAAITTDRVSTRAAGPTSPLTAVLR